MGQRKKDIALLFVGGAVAAGEFEYGFAGLALYVVANVVMHLAGKSATAKEK